MLRLVLLLLYLAGSFAVFGRTEGGGGWDPLGLNAPTPQVDGGGGLDPLGLDSPPPPEPDRGSGWDPWG